MATLIHNLIELEDAGFGVNGNDLEVAEALSSSTSRILWLFPITTVNITHILLKPYSVRLADKWAVRLNLPDGILTIPARFVTDYVSVPDWAWMVVTNGGMAKWAGVVHDYLYYTCGMGLLTRQECDLILDDLLQRLGYGVVRRQLVYRGVRWGGGPHFGPSNTASGR